MLERVLTETTKRRSLKTRCCFNWVFFLVIGSLLNNTDVWKVLELTLQLRIQKWIYLSLKFWTQLFYLDSPTGSERSWCLRTWELWFSLWSNQVGRVAFFIVQAVCFAWEIYYKRIALSTMPLLYTQHISFGKYLSSISATFSASPVFRVGELLRAYFPSNWTSTILCFEGTLLLFIVNILMIQCDCILQGSLRCSSERWNDCPQTWEKSTHSSNGLLLGTG